MKGFPDLPPLWLLLFLGLGASVVQIWGVGGLANPTTQAVGVGVAACGLALIAWSALCFYRRRTTIEPHHAPTALIVEGPYRFTRNPIYLGMAVILAGAVIWWGRPVLGILVPLFAAVIEIRFVRPEEAALRHAFGPEAERYIAATKRWL